MIDDDVDVDVVEVVEAHGRVCKDKMYNAVNVGSCQNVKVLTISGQGVELEEAVNICPSKYHSIPQYNTV